MDVREGTLGRLIRSARAKRGWTQAQLADACEIHDSLVSHIENDYDKTFSREILRKIAKALRLQTDVVLLANGQLPDWADAAVREDPEGACDVLNHFQWKQAVRTRRNATEKMIDNLSKIGV